MGDAAAELGLGHILKPLPCQEEPLQFDQGDEVILAFFDQNQVSELECQVEHLIGTPGLLLAVVLSGPLNPASINSQAEVRGWVPLQSWQLPPSMAVVELSESKTPNGIAVPGPDPLIGQQEQQDYAGETWCVALSCPGCIRIDLCQTLSVDSCRRLGAAGTISHFQLLPEILTKLGKIPKYGA